MTLILNDDQGVEDLTVIHHARSGAKFNRADQYIHSSLSQVPGITQFYWTGTWATKPSFTMKGELVKSKSNKWTYSEQQFERGRLRYAMLSVCHVEENSIDESLLHEEQARRELAAGDVSTAILLVLESPRNKALGNVRRDKLHTYDTSQEILKTAIQALREKAVLAGHTDVVSSAVFSPDGSRIVTGSYDHTARLWDIEGKHIATLSGHADAVRSAVFSPDGNRILTASSDGSARLWSADGSHLLTFSGQQTDSRQNTIAAFSPDGTRVLTVLDREEARVWRIDGALLAIMRHEGNVNSAIFSPDGQRILTTSDNTARLWDGAGNILATLTHDEKPNSAVFSPDGLRILTSTGGYVGEEHGFAPGAARIWDSNGTMIRSFPTYSAGVEEASFSPDGKYILVVSADLTEIWDAETGNKTGSHTVHEGQVTLARFTPQGNKIASASGSSGMWSNDDFSVQVSDVKWLGSTEKYSGHIDEVRDIEFSADGKLMLTASTDNTARLWNMENIEVLEPKPTPGGQGLLALAKQVVPRCLTQEQRKEFFLAAEPPAWCIEMAKWPYGSQKWKTWLTERRNGGNPPPPE